MHRGNSLTVNSRNLSDRPVLIQCGIIRNISDEHRVLLDWTSFADGVGQMQGEAISNGHKIGATTEAMVTRQEEPDRILRTA